MMLFGIIRVYENQLYLYRLTENHYKAQTLLAYTDYWLKEHNKNIESENRIVPAALYFEEGIGTAWRMRAVKSIATVTLQMPTAKRWYWKSCPRSDMQNKRS